MSKEAVGVHQAQWKQTHHFVLQIQFDVNLYYSAESDADNMLKWWQQLCI